VWLTSAVGVFVSVVAIVLSTQHAWTLAFVQFTSHVTIRGRTDNLLPDLHTPYAIVFSVIPFLLLAVVPACVSIWHWRRRDTEWLVAVSFLAGAAVWLLVNKRDLLLARHFLFVSKSVFLGVYGTRLGRSAWLRIGALLVVATINLYAFKDEFLYLATPLRAEAQRSAAAIHPAGVLAVDSLYFVTFYRSGETLDYSSLLVTPMWPAYRAAIPDRFRAGLLAGLADAPAQPSMLIVSAMSVFRFGEPQLENFQCSGARQPISRLRVLGRTWNLPAHPYDVRLCTLR
jgi:hypothetical protein